LLYVLKYITANTIPTSRIAAIITIIMIHFVFITTPKYQRKLVVISFTEISKNARK